jgi:hypothetical protein
MKKILIGACAMALLSACGQRGAADTAAEAPAQAAPAPVSGASPEANAKRMRGYAAALFPLVAGTYGGNCATVAGPAPKEGIVISGAGQASAPGFARNLADAEHSFGVSRTAQGGTTETAILYAESTEPKWAVHISSGPRSTAMFGDGDAQTSCQQVPPLGLMQAKDIYTTVAPLFTGEAVTLSCTVELLSVRDLTVKAGPDGVSVDGKLISLKRPMKKEVADVEWRAGKLTYSALFDDGSQLNMSVDDSGKITDLSSSSAGKVAYMCSKGSA